MEFIEKKNVGEGGMFRGFAQFQRLAILCENCFLTFILKCVNIRNVLK
jgi:hypothetical protein